MRQWDVFISHASEDKPDVVVPLVDALKSAGLRVWLDRQELRVGDRLRAKIEEGLANSRCGIVVLSPNFFAKQWPQRELDGLFALEEAHATKLILPLWHGVDKFAVSSHSPILADRVAADTADGISIVVSKILQAIEELPPSGSVDLAPTRLRLLVRMLDSEPDHHGVVDFFGVHKEIVMAALGFGVTVAGTVQIDNYPIDLCARAIRFTTEITEWHLIQFAASGGKLVSPDDIEGLDRVVSRVRRASRWAARNVQQVQGQLPNFDPLFCKWIVVAGRREQLAPEAIDSLREYNRELVGIAVRTYDWLIDAAVNADVNS
jgi:hypothetical protein